MVQGDKITAQHLFCSEERGIYERHKGLLQSELERKKRTCFVTSFSSSSTIRVKNMLWHPKSTPGGILGELQQDLVVQFSSLSSEDII